MTPEASPKSPVLERLKGRRSSSSKVDSLWRALGSIGTVDGGALRIASQAFFCCEALTAKLGLVVYDNDNDLTHDL